MGEEGSYKYLYEVKPYDLFILKMELIDVNKNTVIEHCEEKAKKEELGAKIDRMISRLSEYFKPIGPPKPPALTPWIGVSPSCIIPFGTFGRIIDAAGGVTLDIGLRHLGAPNVNTKISGGYYFLSKNNGVVQSYQSGQLSILAGYSFALPLGFSIMPMLGIGCQFHVVKDFKYTLPYIFGHTVRTAYYDPLVTIRCEGAYNLYKDLYVTLTPGYTILFENSETGHYINIDIGVKYEFEIPHQSRDPSVNDIKLLK
jgi:hypothetical protein